MHNHTMVSVFLSLLGALRSALRTHADLALENLALRQQLANFRSRKSSPHRDHPGRIHMLNGL
jgi:hypothetical protein